MCVDVSPSRAKAFLLGILFALALGSRARADNAAFALAPRNAVIAIDARAASDVLGVGGAALRPVLESIAGPQALATFDLLARRTNAQGGDAAREVFAGRVAFYLTDDGAGGYRWLFGVQADDERCERVLRMLNARMSAPQRFESALERLSFRRIGGWLLMTPSEAADTVLDGAATRAVAEDAANSLLSEPLIQEFLASEAPVRIFMRHDAPVGGATLIGLTRVKESLRAEVRGTYEDSPLGSGSNPRPLDDGAVGSLESLAAFAVTNPADGSPSVSDAFWLALVPEFRLSPAMKANLAGERLVAVGPSRDPARPAVAFAWKVDDARQGEADQDAYMRGVCCGLLRAAETAQDPAFANSPNHTERLRNAARHMTDPERATSRSCDALGPFIDRYLGTPFKLGGSELHWMTVETPCGGWQIYATDTDWMSAVAGQLRGNSCGEGERAKATGVGFCDGPRAAAMVRNWRPLVVDGQAGAERISRGLDALARAVEGLGRMRFRYQTPGPHRVEAILEIDPAVRAVGPPTATQPVRGTSAPGAQP